MPQFFVFSLIIFLEVQAGVAFGLLISSIIKNVEAAPKVAPVIVVLLLMFSGFFLNGLIASCCTSGPLMSKRPRVPHTLVPVSS